MTKRKIAIILCCVFITAFLVYLITSKPAWIFKPKTSEPVKTESASANQEHAQENKEHQAKAEPLQAEETEEAPSIEITPEQQQMIGVKTVEASIKPLQKIVRTVGRVEYDEQKVFTVNTKIEGWIEKLYINYTGKYVNKGEPLAEIYSPELIATQQEYLNALKWRSNSELKTQNSELGRALSQDFERLLEAARQRLSLWDINDSQIKKIEETGKPVRTLTIYSPVSGYVIQKMALQGIKVMPGEKLFDVVDLSSVWIISDIYEYELPFIREGQAAKISLSYFPGKEFSSRIDYIYPSLSGETRTAKVRFTIPNYKGALKPQMFTNVEVKIDLGKRLAIPDSAIIDTGTRQVVYVDKGDGRFEPREVLSGVKAEGLREVIKGVKAGEKVAASATFLIDSEAQLKNVTPLGKHKH